MKEATTFHLNHRDFFGNRIGVRADMCRCCAIVLPLITLAVYIAGILPYLK